MRRLFIWLAATAILMVLVAGLGVFGMTYATVSQAKHDAAAAEAKSVAESVSSHINAINNVLDKMAKDPEVLAAVTTGDAATKDAVAANLEKHLPDIMKVRLLSPGVSEIDERTVPRMGFADLSMVQDTFSKNLTPAILGDNGPDRHLAIARGIKDGGKVVGVILASFHKEIATKYLPKSESDDIYLELRQGTLVLGGVGNKANAEQSGDQEGARVEDTDWKIYYQYASGAGLTTVATIAGIVAVAILTVLLVAFLIYRKLSEILTHDLQTLMKIIKDIMEHNVLGVYPVQLAETNAVVATIMQFKRVLENVEAAGVDPTQSTKGFNMNITVGEDEEFNMFMDKFDENAKPEKESVIGKI